MNVALRSIKRNDGQLDWLPRNPRQWTQTDIDRTAASIREDGDFLEEFSTLKEAKASAYAGVYEKLRKVMKMTGAVE